MSLKTIIVETTDKNTQIFRDQTHNDFCPFNNIGIILEKHCEADWWLLSMFGDEEVEHQITALYCKRKKQHNEASNY